VNLSLTMDGPMFSSMQKEQSMMSIRRNASKNVETSKEGELVRAWLAQVLDERIDKYMPLDALLHDGVLLCRLINRIHPDAIPSINAPTSTQFLLRDNVETFLKKCVTVLKLKPTVLFDVADLFDGKNMKRVYGTLHAISICQESVDNGIPPLKLTHRRSPSQASNEGDSDVPGPNHQKLLLSADASTIIQHIRDRITSQENPNGISTLHEAASMAEFVKAIEPIITQEKEDPNVRDRNGLTPLYYAVEKQVSCCVERLLKFADPSIHYPMKFDQTVLHLAVTLPSAKIVDLLIHAKGTDINALTSKKNTPLLTSLIMKQPAHALALIEAGADVSIPNTQGNTPLHIAIKINSVDCVRALLLHGADINVKNNAGDSAKTLAANDGVHPQIVYLIENPERAKLDAERKRMLDPKKDNPEEEKNDNENEVEKEEEKKEEKKEEEKKEESASGSEHSSESGSSEPSAKSSSSSESEKEIDVEKTLIDAAHEGDAGTFRMTYEEHSKELKSINFTVDGWTCLHAAATAGSAPLVKFILGLPGVDTNVKGKDGSTPLVCAMKNNHKDCVALLMEEGKSDLNATSESGWNPVLLAAYNADMESIDMLCELAKKGAVNLDVPQKEAKGYHVLHFAAASKDHAAEAITKLLDAGAEINALNDNGQTPLHIAAFWDNAEAVRVLLDRGADKTIKNKHGRTAAELAIHYDYVDLLKIFGCLDKRIKNPKKPKFKKLEAPK